jgi:hypothetical protein
MEAPMSEEIHNSRVIKISASLPGSGCDDDCGYIGIMTDGSRGYCGWVSDGDATIKAGRTVRHPDWQSGLAAMQNPAREIHDFYFEPHIPAVECGCCDGSGKNKAYKELYDGFYRRGGGRWAGWGAREFHEDEIDYLYDRGRFGGMPRSQIDGRNFHRHFDTFFGMDSSDHHFLTPIRAKHLGIATYDCEECLGRGLAPSAPARISLNVWTFDPEAGTSRVDVVEDVRMDELDEARAYLSEVGWEGVMRRFGWAVGDNFHSAIPYEGRFVADPRRRFRSSNDGEAWYDHNIRYRYFSRFAEDYDLGDPDRWERADDYNLVFDCRIIAPEGYEVENPFSSSELPERYSVLLWMTHPRKGADRQIRIDECSREDGDLIRYMLERSFAVHGRHFSWAVGREFGNEERLEDELAEDEDSFSSMRVFAGI